MKNIVWDPGMIPPESLASVVDAFLKKGNRIHLVTERTQWRIFEPECKVTIYRQLEDCVDFPQSLGLNAKYFDVVKRVIDDHRTLLIAERVSKYNDWYSVFNLTQKIETMVYNSFLLLEDQKPDFLLFQATPHALNSWILGKVAECLKIPVYLIQTSPLPWRFWLVKGIDEQTPFFPQAVSPSQSDLPYLDHFLTTNSSSYKAAIPSYEKIRIEGRGGKFWSWKKELFDCFKHPSLLKSLFKKRKLYSVYTSLAEKASVVEGKKVVFFMHYQPERTSLPEGKWFSQQWLIIHALSICLPEGWTLCVKEHPSIFTGKFDFRYRHPNFYRNVSLLANVKLVPLETDTFSLIDNSEMVVTITGTVGVQSLIRGRPVLLFGYGSYRKAYGVHEVDSLDDISTTIAKISEIDSKNLITLTEKFLEKVGSVSISPLREFSKEIDVYSKDTRVKGHIELLRTFLLSL